MQAAEIPRDEAKRLKALRMLGVLDTPAEERFDRLTRLARRSFGVPIALVSLIDANRQWFKSRQGLEATETPRDISFCGHAILGSDTLVIPDAHADERFADNPLVTAEPCIRFYAGRPISAPDGCKIGTLCLIDSEPRSFTDEDLELLDDLAEMVEDELTACQIASIDELTGLSNRRGFHALAQTVLALCQRLQKSASLLFIDLDGFKPINDRFGHEEGDRALREVADMLVDAFRNSDVIARLGGDEFGVLLTHVSAAELKIPMERFAQRVQLRNAAPEARYAIGYSVGVATSEPEQPLCLEELMSQADRLMYEKKQENKREGARSC